MEKSIEEVLGPNNICVIVSEFILTPWKEYIFVQFSLTVQSIR